MGKSFEEIICDSSDVALELMVINGLFERVQVVEIPFGRNSKRVHLFNQFLYEKGKYLTEIKSVPVLDVDKEDIEYNYYLLARRNNAGL